MRRGFYFVFIGLILSSTSAFAFVSPYVGINVGVSKNNLKFDIPSFNTRESAGNINALIGANAGVELNVLLMKFGIEAFIDKGVSVHNSGTYGVSYQDPLLYGLKGKIIGNLIFVEPYLAVGIGREDASNYKNTIGLVGLGIQAKLLRVGAFLELHYITALNKKDYTIIKGTKSDRIAMQFGLKYFF